MSEPRQTVEERMAEHKPKTYASGGYIPDWGESKPVGYYPGKDDPTPTPIDPADIRAGDVFRVIYQATCERIDDASECIITTTDVYWDRAGDPNATYHLVHRPDPDAEAAAAMRSVIDLDDEDVRLILGALRKIQWRAES